MKQRNPYEVLGVAKDADQQTIKSAFRKLAMAYHPDKNAGDPQAEAKFKEISAAYEILSDPERRGAFDRFGFENPNAGPVGNAGFPQGFGSDIFESFFRNSGFFGGRERQQPANGRDLLTFVEIDLIDVIRGTEKEISVDRTVTCGTCHGQCSAPGISRSMCGKCKGQGEIRQRTAFIQFASTCDACAGQGSVITSPCPSCSGQGICTVKSHLKVSIPSGVETDNRLRLVGQGEASTSGAAPGDLYVNIRVRQHHSITREGRNTRSNTVVGFPAMCLGGRVTVQTLDGSTEITIPAGSQQGDVIKIDGRGLPSIDNKSRGDHLVTLSVHVPKNVSNVDASSLRSLAASWKVNVA